MLASVIKRGLMQNRTLLRNPCIATAVRNYSDNTPWNTVVLFVPQQEAWVVERMGKYNSVLEPGINFLIPVLDKIKYVQNLKELAIDVPHQAAITADNVTLTIDAVLYLRVIDPYLASYGVEDAEFAITQVAQTTMRSEIGKISLDFVFRERESLNVTIVQAINKAAEAWGITCLRYEIRDITLPPKVQEAMQMQVEAERKKRAAVLQSEGIRESEINVAEGRRQARILASEADKTEQVNKAKGRAEAFERMGEALKHSQGLNAASLSVAQDYISAFNNLAQKSNTLILPANAGDVTGSVASALSIYQKISQSMAEHQKEEGEVPEKKE